jgi:hypothetical protein
VLAAKRGERGLTIQQAASATRIRAEHLAALEADDTERFAAPVYAKGYLRNYARYLGLDPEPQVTLLHHGPRDPHRALGLRHLAVRPRLVLTAPAVASAGLVVWINVIVDGKPQYADAGKTLQAGSQVYFTGVDVKVTSGGAGATFVTIDGHALGALGAGVATREFSSQTSP